MLNRNASRHLLLVVSILLCAFIYAGYSLVTRGEADPAEGAAAPAEGVVSGLRPAGGAEAPPIPSADGGSLSLLPPAAQSMRPPSLPPAVVSGGSESISGLVPDDSSGAEDSAPPEGSGLMPGANLPIPGFASVPAEPSEDASASPPVLTLPGMSGAAGGDFGEEDFGDEDGDFAALPGFEAPAETTAAPVLPPPPGATGAPPPATVVVPRPAALAPPPAVATPAAGAEAVLRPPPQSVPPARGAEDAPPSLPPPARPVVAPPSAPARTAPPAPARTALPDGMVEEAEDASGSRSGSLRIYVVMPGDTLSSIAMRELGSGSLADNIFLLNRDVIDDPNHLMAGVKIRLPYANPAAAGSGADGAPVRRPTQGLGGTHRVVRGDTLSSIAQQYYGQSAAWRFLHEANRAIIPNPDQLTVGMELSIPPYGE